MIALSLRVCIAVLSAASFMFSIVTWWNSRHESDDYFSLFVIQGVMSSKVYGSRFKGDLLSPNDIFSSSLVEGIRINDINGHERTSHVNHVNHVNHVVTSQDFHTPTALMVSSDLRTPTGTILYSSPALSHDSITPAVSVSVEKVSQYSMALPSNRVNTSLNLSTTTVSSPYPTGSSMPTICTENCEIRATISVAEPDTHDDKEGDNNHNSSKGDEEAEIENYDNEEVVEEEVNGNLLYQNESSPSSLKVPNSKISIVDVMNPFSHQCSSKTDGSLPISQLISKHFMNKRDVSYVSSLLVSQSPLVNLSIAEDWNTLHSHFIMREEFKAMKKERYMMRIGHGWYMEHFFFYDGKVVLNTTHTNDLSLQVYGNDMYQSSDGCSMNFISWGNSQGSLRKLQCSPSRHDGRFASLDPRDQVYDRVLILWSRGFGNIYHNAESVSNVWKMYLKMDSFPLFDYVLFYPPTCFAYQWSQKFLSLAFSMYPQNAKPVIINMSHSLKRMYIKRSVLFAITTSIYDVFTSYEEPMLIRKIAYNEYHLDYQMKQQHNKKLTLLHIKRTRGERQILNWKSIQERLLLEFSPKCISIVIANFAKLSPSSQISNVFHADMVMSIHGAALINIVFMLPFSGLVEFMNPFVSYRYFQKVAFHSQLFYAVVKGECDIKPRKGSNPRELDLRMKVDEVIETVKLISSHILLNKYCSL